ncbi:MAG: homoserine kinase [Candidatus Bathyarchaeia archaeon]
MPPSQVTVKAPATSANLGPGYDVFGLALEYPSDKVTVTADSAKGIRIQVTGFSADHISTIPERNTSGVVAAKMMQQFHLDTGLTMRVEKGIWPGRGLGSSAASAAATACALNHLFNLNLTNAQLVQFAAAGEVVSAGSEHADNVAAAVCGDFVIVKSYSPVELVCVKAPASMDVCMAFPHVKQAGKTRKARSVLPKTIPLEKLVHNIGAAAAMATGFASGNVDLIGKSMSDAIVEPARTFLIPGYMQVKENALNAGACGVNISGAGPAVIAIVNNRSADAGRVASAMKAGFHSAGYEATAFATKPGRGATIVEK